MYYEIIRIFKDEIGVYRFNIEGLRNHMFDIISDMYRSLNRE